MLESAQEVHGSLQQARLRPHVMDDYTISRVCEAHGTQLDDLWLDEKQLSRWQTPAPSEAEQQEITRLSTDGIDLCGTVYGERCQRQEIPNRGHEGIRLSGVEESRR